MLETEKERPSEENLGRQQYHKAEEKMFLKPGVINNYYILRRDFKKKDTGSKIPSDLANISLISVRK